ncbi:MAG: helix-turn-helix domain-containing protein [Acidimicrobiales bacterium]
MFSRWRTCWNGVRHAPRASQRTLTALREQAGLTQRELAKRLGVSQPRVATIERSHNATIDVLSQYVHALGGSLETNVVKGKRKVRLVGPSEGPREVSA